MKYTHRPLPFLVEMDGDSSRGQGFCHPSHPRFSRDNDRGWPISARFTLKQSDPKAQSPITGHVSTVGLVHDGPSVLWAPLALAPLRCQRPPGPPCLSSPIFSLSKDSRGFASCVLARPKPFWNRQLPARHHLSIPCAPSSACQTCHFLMKPTPAPSPEFLLSAGGPTVHPPVTQGENCTCQP